MDQEIVYSVGVVAPSRNSELCYGTVVVQDDPAEHSILGVRISNRDGKEIFLEKEAVGNLASALVEAINILYVDSVGPRWWRITDASRSNCKSEDLTVAINRSRITLQSVIALFADLVSDSDLDLFPAYMDRIQNIAADADSTLNFLDSL